MTQPYRRLDIWLWYARIARQRGLCASLCESGLIRINRRPINKPHAKLYLGDILTLPALPPHDVRVLRVIALGEKRAAASEARLLYDEVKEAAEKGSEQNPAP